MKRMQTFLTYALIIIGFYFFSNFLIDFGISSSYKDVEQDKIKIEQSNNGFEIEVDKANSNRRQAYFTGTVKNNSDKVIEKQYVKVDSYFKGKLMQEKYLAFENMQPGEERKFKLLYSLGQIDEFRVSYVDEIPSNRTIVDKAIDKAVEVFNNAKAFVSKFDGVSLDGTAEGVKNGASGIATKLKEGFKPVHVEGEDWELFVAVMLVWAAIPSGAIWFII
jgi:hypothetical protein